MTLAEHYRNRAQGLKERADNQPDLRLRLELEMLAQKYFLLAMQAERNASNDVVYEPPMKGNNVT